MRRAAAYIGIAIANLTIFLAPLRIVVGGGVAAAGELLIEPLREEVVRRANDTAYGLQAGVFTRDLYKALHAARTLDFGGVVVNDVPTWRADNQPYGGVRDSGNTREGPAYTAREMTEARLVAFDLGT